MNKKTILLVEIIWIAIGSVCLYISVKEFVTNHSKQSWMFLAMSLISFLLAWIRDHQRKKS